MPAGPRTPSGRATSRGPPGPLSGVASNWPKLRNKCSKAVPLGSSPLYEGLADRVRQRSPYAMVVTLGHDTRAAVGRWVPKVNQNCSHCSPRCASHLDSSPWAPRPMKTLLGGYSPNCTVAPLIRRFPGTLGRVPPPYWSWTMWMIRGCWQPPSAMPSERPRWPQERAAWVGSTFSPQLGWKVGT